MTDNFDEIIKFAEYRERQNILEFINNQTKEGMSSDECLKVLKDYLEQPYE